MDRMFIWAEISVADMERARTFYERVLQTELHAMPIGDTQYAFFPVIEKYNGGALVQAPDRKPSADGVTLFLYGGPDMTPILERVLEAGGQVLMEKTYNGHAGYVGLFLDSEGNRIGLQHL